MSLSVRCKRLHEEAVQPAYATDGAACLDLHALVLDGGGSLAIEPGGRVLVRTGWALQVPEGSAMLIYSRSGHGAKHGVRLANCTGVIDSDYRGEVMVAITNDGDAPFWIAHADRIAQAMIVAAPRIRLDVVADLSETARGSGGFGSTGTGVAAIRGAEGS